MKSTVWLNDARDFDDFNGVYGDFFPGKRPARPTMQATNVVGSKIGVEVIAYKP